MFALAYSGFPVELSGVGELHAAFLNESRTRGCWWRPVAGNPDTWAENEIFECSHFTPDESLWHQQEPFARRAEALEGLRPVFFGPCTPRRTWSTRPGMWAWLFAQEKLWSLLPQPRFAIDGGSIAVFNTRENGLRTGRPSSGRKAACAAFLWLEGLRARMPAG